MTRTTCLSLTLLALSACGEDAASDGKSGSAGAGGNAGVSAWQAHVVSPTPILTAPDGGCLVNSGTELESGATLIVRAADTRFVLLDSNELVRAGDVELEPEPAVLPVTRSGSVAIDTPELRYDEQGCPAPTGQTLFEHAEIDAIARFFDANYRGEVVIDRTLTLASLRAIEAEGWSYPWHAAVQIVKQVPEGFVIGGGVLVAPRAILTVAHLGVDATYCYSREADAGDAWAAGKFHCTNITFAEAHPSVDVAIVRLANDEPPPFAIVGAPLSVGDTFFTLNYGKLNSHAMSDASVAKIGSDNAFCAPWPDGSSVVTDDLVLAPGDSGGPAFRGDDLVGIAHGERCKLAFEPVEHVFVHVPGISDWLAQALAQ